MRRAVRVAGLATALALVAAMIAPTAAPAWKYVFQDFFDIQGGGIGAAFAVAKKCHGGKLGYYKFRSKAGGSAARPSSRSRSSSTCRFAEFKSVNDVDVTVEASEDFDESVVNEIIVAYGTFFNDTKTRWSPGDLRFKHPELIVFGEVLLSEGKHLEDFKPKDKC